MNSDFAELLTLLHDCRVEYLVVGGYAVIHYAEPRYTKDLDLWIRPELANAQRFREALLRFGGWVGEMTAETFAEEGVMFQIGLPPTRVDFLTSVAGVQFATCWERREPVELAGTLVPFISREDLITAKLSSARPQDLLDAATLRSVP